jgi:hypothetical protein
VRAIEKIKEEESIRMILQEVNSRIIDLTLELESLKVEKIRIENREQYLMVIN